jgi:HEAT repeat protein
MLKAKRFRLPNKDASSSVCAGMLFFGVSVHLSKSKGDLNITSALKYINDTDKLVRVQACIALGLLKNNSASPHLITLLQTEEDPQVRQNAVKSLGLLAASEALPVLQTVSKCLYLLQFLLILHIYQQTIKRLTM